MYTDSLSEKSDYGEEFYNVIFIKYIFNYLPNLKAFRIIFITFFIVIKVSFLKLI